MNLQKERYCRRLGHPVPFSYCCATADGTPCAGILGCWAADQEMAPAARDAAARLPQSSGIDKRLQLYELIQKAAGK